MKSILILPLLLLVVITPTVAFARDESSYKYGYDGAFGIFNCLTHDWKVPPISDCDVQGYSFNQYDTCLPDAMGGMTNETACTDGNADGFAHWCVKNIAFCSKQIRADAIPHIIQKHEIQCDVDPRNNTSICKDVGTDAISHIIRNPTYH